MTVLNHKTLLGVYGTSAIQEACLCSPVYFLFVCFCCVLQITVTLAVISLVVDDMQHTAFEPIFYIIL